MTVRSPDQGGLTGTLSTSHDEHTIFLDFYKPVLWVRFTPTQARQLAAELLKRADVLDPPRQVS